MTGIARLYFVLAFVFTINAHAQYDLEEMFGAMDGQYTPNIHYASWCEDDKVIVSTGPHSQEIQKDCRGTMFTHVCREKWTRNYSSQTVTAHCVLR